MSLALYIHWPFCKAKCPYCDFNSHVREGVDAAAWQTALLAELRHMAAWMPSATLTSIFFGGGTPSLMPPRIVAALIDEASALFQLSDTIEITLEANPTSVEAGKFAAFAKAGVNRVSLGVQSLDPAQLTFLGREHSANEALQAIALAQKYFRRYSFDLIYALPNQRLAQWEKQLQQALTHADKHVSLYQLTIEANTAFHHMYHAKRAFSLPKDDDACELFSLTQSIMQSCGLPAYEISNHASPGEESRHNLSYWRGDAYLGIGPGAHGRALIGGKWHATETLKSPERWLAAAQQNGHAISVCDRIGDEERAEEHLLTGLRLQSGVEWEKIAGVINLAATDRYIAQGLLKRTDTHLRATTQGWLVLNRLVGELL